MKKLNIYILLVVVVVALLIIFSTSDPENGEELIEEVAKETTNEPGEEALEEEREEGDIENLTTFDKFVELEVGKDGFAPQEFVVKTKDVVRIDLTSKEQSCFLRFEHPDLQAVKIDVLDNETKEKIFGKPLEGDYVFYCDGDNDQLTGLMRVEYLSE